MKFVSRMSGFASRMRSRSSWLFLAGVAREGRSQIVRQPRLVEELLELLHLAIGQRVHRIDDDGAGARRLRRRRARGSPRR